VEDEKEEKRSERIIVGMIKYDEEKIRVVGAYIKGDMECKLEELRDWMEEKRMA